MRSAGGFTVLLGALLLVADTGSAAILWSGPTITFTKSAFADWTLPQNQDRLTSTVWLTRPNTQGLFNIEQETGYTHDLSPAGTEWAYGSAASWPSLTFTDWETWANNSPPGTVGQDAVLHLIADDIYLDIKFLSWGVGSSAGGSFSYERSTPEPATALLLVLGGLAMARRKLL